MRKLMSRENPFGEVHQKYYGICEPKIATERTATIGSPNSFSRFCTIRNESPFKSPPKDLTKTMSNRGGKDRVQPLRKVSFRTVPFYTYVLVAPCIAANRRDTWLLSMLPTIEVISERRIFRAQQLVRAVIHRFSMRM